MIRITFLCWMLTVKTSNAITTRLEHPSHSSFRRHIGTLSINDWESGLREATYQALLRENNREPSLRDQIYYAPLEGRQDAAIPFGDIIVLARGQLYSTYNGFKFVQDPYRNDCDDCHNGRIKCSQSQCRGWNPIAGEQLIALWTVKRIRHRDPVYGHRYELEYTLSPISAVVNNRYLLADGGFDYNIPGHVFIIKTDPSIDKSGFHTTSAGTTWFNNNYVNLDGRKMQTTKSSDEEIEIYKELIKSLAMKTSTSLKPIATSPLYSDIFDATIQKVPVTMIHQQTIPAQKAPSTTTSVWTTPVVEETKATRYSEPDPLYHSTTGRKASKAPPITTITFFAPDESVTENDIFGSVKTTVTTTARAVTVTSETVHADIFDVVDGLSTNIQTQSTNKYSTNTMPEETTVVITTARPSTSERTTTVKRTIRPYSKRTSTRPTSTTATTPRTTTAAITPRTTTTTETRTTTTTKQPTRRTRKPFIPNRFTRPKPTRRRTTTSAEFDEIFLQKTSTTAKSSTTEELVLTTRSTTPSIFDVSIEEVEKSTTVKSTPDVATSATKLTTLGVDGTTERSSEVEITSAEKDVTKITSSKVAGTTEVSNAVESTSGIKTTETSGGVASTLGVKDVATSDVKLTSSGTGGTTERASGTEVTTKLTTEEFDEVTTTKTTVESSLTTPYRGKYTKPVSTTTESANADDSTVKYGKKRTKKPLTTTTKSTVNIRIPSSTTDNSTKSETRHYSEKYTKTPSTTTENVYETSKKKTMKTPLMTEETSKNTEIVKDSIKPQPTTITTKNVYVSTESSIKTTETTKITKESFERNESEKDGKEYTKPQLTATTKNVNEKSETTATTRRPSSTLKENQSESEPLSKTTTVKYTTTSETTTPIVFVGTIITRRTTKKPEKTKQEDVYDIFGEQTPTVIEKPTTDKGIKTTITDDFLFGSEIKQFPTTTQEPVVIYDNFFEASTSSTSNNNTTQVENNTEGEPLTSMSYITSISFQVNGKNVTQQNATLDTMLKANVKEIATNASDFKVFKAEMPDTNTTKQQFDEIALSLINHARSVDILNKTTNKAAKQKRRRSYTPRRGRKKKIRREKMV